MSDDRNSDRADQADEVVTPDEVTAPGEEAGPAATAPARTRPDRRPLWAMIAGLDAVWFALFGPLLVVVIAPLAFILSRRVLAGLPDTPENKKVRRQGRIGLYGGIIGALLLVVQIILVQLFFEWEKDVPEADDKPAATAPAEGEG